MHIHNWKSDTSTVSGGKLVREFCARYCGEPDSYRLKVGGRSIDLFHEPVGSSVAAILANERAVTVRQIEVAKSHLAELEEVV